MSHLVHDFIFDTARATPQREALVHGVRRLDYAALALAVRTAAAALLAAGLGRGERVAVYMEKNVENVAAMFGAAAAGGVFVPINPLLKPEQVAYILADCNVRVLVTSADRLRLLASSLALCPDLRMVLAVNPGGQACPDMPGVPVFSAGGRSRFSSQERLEKMPRSSGQ